MRAIFNLIFVSLFFIPFYSSAESMPMSTDHDHMTMQQNVQTYESEGVITQWQSDRVGISHHAIPALKWPAMTMNFRLPPEIAARSLPAGTPVTFSFVKTDSAYQLQTLSPLKR
ncbi:copper-binding protein [Rahnella sp. L151-1A]|jgi:Cu(I)/Ag(I) efflux system periplasmic protein CusF|nr:copper-binding protein [Rahnella perminowiae]